METTQKAPYKLFYINNLQSLSVNGRKLTLVENAVLSELVKMQVANKFNPIYRKAENLAKQFNITATAVYKIIKRLIDNNLLIRVKGYLLGEKNYKNTFYSVTPKTADAIGLDETKKEKINKIIDLLKQTAEKASDFFSKRKAKEIKYNAEKPKTWKQVLIDFFANLRKNTAPPENYSDNLNDSENIAPPENYSDNLNDSENIAPPENYSDSLNDSENIAPPENYSDSEIKLKLSFYLTNKGNIIKNFYGELYLLKKEENFSSERYISNEVQKMNTIKLINKGQLKEISEYEVNTMRCKEKEKRKDDIIIDKNRKDSFSNLKDILNKAKFKNILKG